MSNVCMFVYPDRTLAASLTTTGTAWSTGLPLSNLNNKLKGKVARSAGITTAHTKFDITLPAAKPVNMIALLAHNAFTDATVTISFSAVSAGGSELGQVVNAPLWGNGYYPATIPLEWEEDEYWGGTICDADASDFRTSPDYWYVLPQTENVQFIRVEITDTNNTAGYFQIGRCFVGNGLQPTLNMDYGASVAWKQDVLKETSIGGVDWFEVRSQGREITGTLSNMTFDEGAILFFERQRRLGQEGELYFIFDPSDTIGVNRQRAMLCRFGDEDALQYPYFNAASGSFRLVEVR